MNYTKKNFQSSEFFPHDLVIEGTLLNARTEHRTWTKDDVQKEMDVMLLLLQTANGEVFACRSFNPSYKFDDFKAGDKICLPIAEYRIDNMLKCVVIRI